MTFASTTFWTVVLAGTVSLATPLMFAALGETVVELSGVLNLGIEGMMLMGALGGIAGSHVGGSMVGVLAGLAVGALFGGVMALGVSVMGANQIIVGIAITFVGTGLSDYLFEVWSPTGQTVITAPLVPTIRVPVLSRIPVVGQALFHESILTYVALALVVSLTWFLRKSRFGLLIRACGDDPGSAQIRGVRTRNVQVLTLLVGGAMAGLGGAAITIGYLGSFVADVTNGSGFIAIAIVIIGAWSPLGCLAGALMFGFFQSLGLQAQTVSLGLPVECYDALPYVVTLLVLFLTVHRRRAPAALGLPLPTGGE